MGTRDEYVDLMKSAFVTISVRIVSNGVSAVLAAFGLGGLSGFLSFFINALMKKFFTWFAAQTEFQAFFFFIDTRVGQQGRDFENAAYKNREAQTNGTKEEKQKAENELWVAFKNLASLKS